MCMLSRKKDFLNTKKMSQICTYVYRHDAGSEVLKNRSSKRKKFQNKSSNITFLKEKFQKFKIIKYKVLNPK